MQHHHAITDAGIQEEETRTKTDAQSVITSLRPTISIEREEDIVTLAMLERRYIERVLLVVDGNKSRAAQLLGLDRRTLYRKLTRYESSAVSSP